MSEKPWLDWRDPREGIPGLYPHEYIDDWQQSDVVLAEMAWGRLYTGTFVLDEEEGYTRFHLEGKGGYDMAVDDVKRWAYIPRGGSDDDT